MWDLVKLTDGFITGSLGGKSILAKAHAELGGLWARSWGQECLSCTHRQRYLLAVRGPGHLTAGDFSAPTRVGVAGVREETFFGTGTPCSLSFFVFFSVTLLPASPLPSLPLFSLPFPPPPPPVVHVLDPPGKCQPAWLGVRFAADPHTRSHS